MGPGLVVYDLLYLTVSGGLYAGALWVTWESFTRLGRVLPWPIAAGVGALCGLVSLVGFVAVLSPLAGPLRPGRFPMLRGRVFYAWVWRSLLRRVLFLPGLKWVLFSSNVLRFLSLRALGARVGFTTQCSTDVDILDPSLTTLGPGATLGARCLLSAHFVEGDQLVLRDVAIGAGALISAEVLIAPGVQVGEHARVHARAALSVGVEVGARALVGAGARVDAFASIAADGVVDTNAYVQPRQRVGPASSKASAVVG